MPRSSSYCSFVTPSQRIFMTLATAFPPCPGMPDLRAQGHAGSTSWWNPPVPLSNDHLELVPVVPAGGAALEFDWPGLRVGVAEYDEGPTGRPVFQFLPSGAACATDVRGGSPGQLGGFEWVHAICL